MKIKETNKEKNNDELTKLTKLFFKINDKKDYLNIIKEIKIPEELKEHSKYICPKILMKKILNTLRAKPKNRQNRKQKYY